MVEYIVVNSNGVISIYTCNMETTQIFRFHSYDEMASFLERHNWVAVNVPSTLLPYNQPACPDYIFIKDRDYYRKIYFDRIIMIEASGSYSFIHTDTKDKYCLSFTLSEIMPRLPANLFIRVHRSYVINLSHVDLFIGNMVCMGALKIPVSKKLRSGVIDRFNVLGRTMP